MTSSGTAAEGAPPLQGVRVLDLGHIVAGPMVGGILGDFGADVIKIENPALHDQLRTLIPHRQTGLGLWSKVEDRNKRPVTINLKSTEGLEIFRRLAATADVIVDNYRPRTLADLGLSDDVLLELNPRLVICHITGWGMTGPFAPRSAYGRIAEATSGFANLNGEADGPPRHSAMSLGDTVASIWAAYGIALALIARTRDGSGQVIDIGLHEPLFRQIETQVIALDQNGVALSRQGNRNGTAPIANMFPTADGRYYTVGSATPRTLEAIIGIAGLDQWPHLATSEAVHENLEEFHERLGAWMRLRTAAEIDEAFAAADAAGAPVLTVDELVKHPQIIARDMVIEVPDDDLGTVRMPGVVPKLLRTPGGVRHAGRAAGAANDEVLTELGYGADDLKRMRDDGII